MNLFYSNQTLDNNIVAVASNEKDVTEESFSNGKIYKVQNKIVGFNIKFDNSIELKNGRLFPTKEILKYLNSKLKEQIEIKTKGFVVGKVIECIPIEGTHLSRCRVDINSEILDIVCGAKNVKKDLKVVVATIGVLMPSGLLIKPSKLKGFDSNGMLCSQKELNINGFNDDGIIELSDRYEIGSIFKEMYSNL